MSIEKQMLDNREDAERGVEKTRPDEPGYWWTYNPHSREVKCVHVSNGSAWGEGRYIKSEPPEFIDYPPKPPQVLVRYYSGQLQWLPIRGKQEAKSICAVNWAVIDHPDNDPEGVRMIEEAREQC